MPPRGGTGEKGGATGRGGASSQGERGVGAGSGGAPSQGGKGTRPIDGSWPSQTGSDKMRATVLRPESDRLTARNVADLEKVFQ
jgi:hypothetical protein